MKLSRTKVRAIVVLIVCALGGLMFLQYRLFMNSVELKEQTFRRNVIAAMNFAVDKLQEIDARNTIFMISDTARLARNPRPADDSSITVSFVTTGPGGTTRMENNQIQRSSEKPQRVLIRAFNTLGTIDTTIIDTSRGKDIRRITLPRSKFAKGVYYVQVRTDSSTTTTRLAGGKQSYSYSINDQDVKKGKVFKRIADSFAQMRYIPMCSRFTRELVDSILAYSLAAHDVPLAFEFGIVSNDSLSLARTQRPMIELVKSEFQVPVIPLEPVPVSEALFLVFPGYRSYLVGTFLPELGSTLLLLGIIIFCFAYTIRTILRQREFAGRLTDFINNMTHEFKTPISTIALASEAMSQPEVRSSRTKVSRYTKVITDENRRMRSQVDKILQMAALEEGETEFTLTSVDLHEIVRRAVANIELQVTARNGTIAAALEAKQANVRGDAVHLENVVHNILDNAVKYSGGAPTISVATMTAENHLVLIVSDRGIGIPKEHLGRVFDKYYRVPTGNIHDVKGFGLGLSYVRLIVEAHGGTVSLSSNPASGTTVELRFPADQSTQHTEKQ
jgi:two-component system, OmpR family, phosphate regulon sensor histidine kinase PhoR